MRVPGALTVKTPGKRDGQAEDFAELACIVTRF
jgi:hypothetical protein